MNQRLLTAAGLCLTLAAAPRATAATFIVNSTGDEPDDNTTDNVCHTAAGTCTYRAAIMQANSRSAKTPSS